MKEEWDVRAETDAIEYIAPGFEGDRSEFYAQGEEIVARHVDQISTLNAPETDSRALDIGCGIGRTTLALADRFDNVVGVDVSEKMIDQTRSHLGHRDDLHFLSTDGRSLSQLGDDSIDFAFSYAVFQHMPSRAVIESNLKEVARVLDTEAPYLIHVGHTTPSIRWKRGWFGIPLPRSLPRTTPYLIQRLYRRLIGEYDQNTDSDSWRGTDLDPDEVEPFFEEAGLEVDGLMADRTHPPGTRSFVHGTSKEHR